MGMGMAVSRCGCRRAPHGHGDGSPALAGAAGGRLRPTPSACATRGKARVTAAGRASAAGLRTEEQRDSDSSAQPPQGPAAHSPYHLRSSEGSRPTKDAWKQAAPRSSCQPSRGGPSGGPRQNMLVPLPLISTTFQPRPLRLALISARRGSMASAGGSRSLMKLDWSARPPGARMAARSCSGSRSLRPCRSRVLYTRPVERPSFGFTIITRSAGKGARLSICSPRPVQ
mmetsp:Transcript_1737/g.5704  ORF Transcript_1737/g.5704 Transcript_1737/m.5704 type:complete len:228 (+) Transcript_1737:577-1260(+)